MSDFKFSCPVCGQHITCDSGSSGTQMDCPTCFRKLVVPQAPASGSSHYVLAAAEVPARPGPKPGKVQPSAPPATPPTHWLSVPALVVGFLVLAAGAGVFLFRGKIFRSRPGIDGVATNTVASLETLPVVAPPVGPHWTLDLAAVQIPDAPATGSVNGLSFTMERATIQGGKLDLRQGAKWPPDVGCSLHLLAERPQELAGQTITIDTSGTNVPHLILRWKDEQAHPMTKEFRQGYIARVEFGQVTSNHLAGKIFVAAPDEAKSYAAGTFSAEIRKASPPRRRAPERAP